MSLFHVFTDDNIRQLIEVNSYGKHSVKNEYLINQLSFVPLSLLEHNSLKVHDLINEKGVAYRKFAVPFEYGTRTPKPDEQERVIELPERFSNDVEKYLNWYVMQDIPSEYRHNKNSYKGLSSLAPMLLNDEFKAYKLTEAKTPKGIKLQPNNLRNKVRALLNNAGLEWATFSTFSDSLIIHLHHNKVAPKELIQLFNYRSRETVLSRIDGNIITLGEAINKVYARVPVTGHNK